MKKQMKHASELGVEFVAMRGEQERADNAWTLRDMKTGDQHTCSEDELLKRVI
jgi:histidyl-tRNA synthetase